MAEITRSLISRVGVDLAKNVIQVHAVADVGLRVVARAIKREQFLGLRWRETAQPWTGGERTTRRRKKRVLCAHVR